MAIAMLLRALFGYFFLVFLVRIVGRRPGKQLTPFEFILIFFLGGLMLTGIVGKEASVSNAICQIVVIAAGHYLLTKARAHSKRVARWLDGTPLILMEGDQWRERTFSKMRISKADAMSVVRDAGLRTFSDVHTATLERNGEISVIPKEQA